MFWQVLAVIVFVGRLLLFGACFSHAHEFKSDFGPRPPDLFFKHFPPEEFSGDEFSDAAVEYAPVVSSVPLGEIFVEVPLAPSSRTRADRTSFPSQSGSGRARRPWTLDQELPTSSSEPSGSIVNPDLITGQSRPSASGRGQASDRGSGRGQTTVVQSPRNTRPSSGSRSASGRTTTSRISLGQQGTRQTQPWPLSALARIARQGAPGGSGSRTVEVGRITSGRLSLAPTQQSQTRPRPATGRSSSAARPFTQRRSGAPGRPSTGRSTNLARMTSPSRRTQPSRTGRPSTPTALLDELNALNVQGRRDTLDNLSSARGTGRAAPVPLPPGRRVASARGSSRVSPAPRAPTRAASVPRPTSRIPAVTRPPSRIPPTPRAPGRTHPRGPTRISPAPRAPTRRPPVPRPTSRVPTATRPPSRIPPTPRAPGRTRPRGPTRISPAPRAPTRRPPVPRPTSRVPTATRPPSRIPPTPRAPGRIRPAPRPPSRIRPAPRPPSRIRPAPRAPARTAPTPRPTSRRIPPAIRPSSRISPTPRVPGRIRPAPGGPTRISQAPRTPVRPISAPRPPGRIGLPATRPPVRIRPAPRAPSGTSPPPRTPSRIQPAPRPPIRIHPAPRPSSAIRPTPRPPSRIRPAPRPPSRIRPVPRAPSRIPPTRPRTATTRLPLRPGTRPPIRLPQRGVAQPRASGRQRPTAPFAETGRPRTPSVQPRTQPTSPRIPSPQTRRESAAKVGSIPIDNGVVGEPEVGCGPTSMTVTFNTENPFEGKTFVKGYFDDPECKVVSVDRARSVSIELPFESCGVVRERSLNPRGIFVSVTVIVSFHPSFVTKVDQAVRAQCFYMEADKTVDTELEVSALTTHLPEVVGTTVLMPVCRYEILEGGPTGQPIRFALIGQQVYHKWTCDTETIDTFCMVVHSCYVDDTSGDRIQIIDENGCALDRHIIQNLEYPSDLMAGQEAHVFKFADRPNTYFNCQIRIEIKEPGSLCDRPVCPEQGRQGRRGRFTRSSSRVQTLDVSIAHPILVGDVDLDESDVPAALLHPSPNAVTRRFNTWIPNTVSALDMEDGVCLSPAGFGILISIGGIFIVATLTMATLMCARRSAKSFY